MKRDYNSSRNQDIKGQFVQREVYLSLNYMFSELQESEDFRENINELFYGQVDWNQTLENSIYQLDEEQKEEILEYYEVSKFEDIPLSDEEMVQYLEDNYRIYPTYEYYEPYEFYAVSPYLGAKLEAYDEVVADYMGFTVWGRCTSGQAILLDYVISKICEDLEILEGMQYEWK